MAKGLDAKFDCSAQAKCIANAGLEFGCRYYAKTGRKRLSSKEAQILSGAGLNRNRLGDKADRNGVFLLCQRVDDGTSAYHAAMISGQPADSPIYFAVDYDAPAAAVAGAIADYFRGIADGFKTISSGSPSHTIGVYGSGATCAWLLQRKFAGFTSLA